MTGVWGPGSRIGVLGGGQLGRMFALAAHQLGYQSHIYAPEADSPAAQVATQSTVACMSDLHALKKFCGEIDVLTYELEQLPIQALEAATQWVTIRPNIDLLRISQNRLLEKNTCRSLRLPVGSFKPVHDAQSLRQAYAELKSSKAVLKTTMGGYDGKGQWLLETSHNLETIVPELSTHWTHDQERAGLILEEFINFDCELSMIVSRGAHGDIATYGPIINDHVNHILHTSECPADLSPQICSDAQQMVESLAQSLDVIGLFCVEFFLTQTGQLLINEIAPRPHNSGHLTIDAHVTSQFEQQARAVTGQRLGSTRQIQPAVMLNLLGDLWKHGPPHFDKILAAPDVHLHLYGKQEPLPGRKMGHLTVASAEEPRAKALEAWNTLATF